MFKILTTSALVIAVAVIVLLTAKQPEPFSQGSQSATRLQPGSYSVATIELNLEDKQRSTDANNDYSGAPTRQLPTTVWYPGTDDDQARPLIIHSHGFSSNRNGGAYLAEHLASLGYIVAAADFPLTHRSAPGGPLAKDVINQPADVSFLIDQLLALNNDPEHRLAAMIDPQRIGLMGISLGGMTTLLSAYHPDMGDPRVSAALSIAGPTEQFTQQFFKRKDMAFLMLSATADALVPYNSNALPVIEKIPGAQLISIEGGSHMGFIGSASLLRWTNHPDAIGCYIVVSKLENNSPEPSWIELLGSPEQGINYQATNQLCSQDSLPKAINPLRQQMISQLVVSSFFDSQFAREQQTRQSASHYLEKTISQEISEVSYQAGQ